MTRHETFTSSSAVAATDLPPLVADGGIAPDTPTAGASAVRPASRIAALVAEYERWQRFWWQMSDQEETALLAHDVAAQDKFKHGQAHAERVVETIVCELLQTPAADLFDLGLKARVLREEKNADWWANGGSIEHAEKIACNIVTELLAATGIRPIDIRPEKPADFCEGYVEGKPIEPLVSAGPQLRSHGFGSFSAAAAECPAAALAQDYARLVDKLFALEELPSDRTVHREELRFHVLDEMGAIERRAPYVRALSAEGALWQLIMAFGEVEQLQTDVKSASGGMAEADRRAERDKVRIQAMLFSVRHFIERQFGVDGEALGGSYMMAASLIQDSLVDAAVAEVKSKRAATPSAPSKPVGAKRPRANATAA